MSAKTKSGHFPAFDNLVSVRANTNGEIVKPCCLPKKTLFLIRLVGPGFLARPKAAPHCSQALGLFIEIINFFIEPRQFGFRRVGTSQLVKRLTDGKFGFSHDNLTFSIKGCTHPNQS